MRCREQSVDLPGACSALNIGKLQSIDAYEVKMNVFKSATCQLLNKRQQYIYMPVHL